MREDAKKRRKMPVRYLTVTVFCLIVSVVYGHFSHGIRSFWMQYLALWPFIFGLIPSALEAAGVLPFGRKGTEGSAEAAVSGEKTEVLKDIYRFGIAAVTVASFLNGVLEIAGTDSFYPEVLLYAGAVMLLCGAAGVIFVSLRKEQG